MLFTESLRKNRDFQRVYHKGKSMANSNLVMYVMPNKSKRNYLGISVSKKIGKAVLRNKVKRRIKESYRISEKNIKAGYSMIFIARAPVKQADFKHVLASTNNLIKRQKLFNDCNKTNNIVDKAAKI